MSADREISRATASDWSDALERKRDTDHASHFENCGTRVDPAVARVVGTDGTVPVCKHCADSRSTDIRTTTMAVQRHRRALYEGGFKQ